MGLKKGQHKVRDRAFEGLPECTATAAKNNFGDLMARVDDGEIVAISRHHETAAVLMPASEYRRLRQATSRKLNLLTDEFDAMVAQMQKPGFGDAMRRVFASTPEEFGAAAVARARRGNG